MVRKLAAASAKRAPIPMRICIDLLLIRKLTEPTKSYLLPIIAEPRSLIPLVTMGRDYRAIDNKRKCSNAFFLGSQASLHPGHAAGTTPHGGSNHPIGRARCLSQALAHEWRLPALSTYVQQHTAYLAPLARRGRRAWRCWGAPPSVSSLQGFIPTPQLFTKWDRAFVLALTGASLVR